MILEMLFSERNHVCSVCVTNGHCELQSLAQKLGITHVDFPTVSQAVPVDASHERFVLDHNRCICARAACACATRSKARTPGT
jgi:bidirectional [NiFe] hydrogenase diaphorase subunit